MHIINIDDNVDNDDNTKNKFLPHRSHYQLILETDNKETKQTWLPSVVGVIVIAVAQFAQVQRKSSQQRFLIMANVNKGKCDLFVNMFK